MTRKALPALLFLVLAFSSFVFSQQNEVALVVGGTVSPAVTEHETFFIAFVCPVGVAPPCGSNATVNIEHKPHPMMSFEGVFARRVLDGHVVSLYIELPVMGSPSRDFTTDSFPEGSFSSLYFTPGLKLKLHPGGKISPFFSIGGGFAHFTTDLSNLGASKGSTRWAAQFGTGVDISTPIKRLALRAEARDFLSGSPKFNSFEVLGNAFHSVLIGGGVVLRF
jgi:hypothetical protein